ncbi:hypothetical protein TIFTF001_042805 [Ficus carica]|uniref:Uncharacterized protein n=1 Tax=Ficus carica TaxID=3494 RepID=A0AA87YQ93_FICCA|nr:hypothetical protein TIFTF001_042800 [Ficus carica]GMN19022.1 hypothetical protein TIFTF001_042804 [Ficus carica]GMN19026.1 hypothetical protein TIFTF001_042805 [Ficus carica]
MTGHRPELEVPDQDPLPSQAPNLWFSNHKFRSYDRAPTRNGSARPGPTCRITCLQLTKVGVG